MLKLHTISDSKAKFYKEFPYVIPGIYSKVVDEMIVELNLLSHQKLFIVDELFSIGLIKAFNELTSGYNPKEHLKLLFNAICNCNDIKPELITNKNKTALEFINNLDLPNINKILEREEYDINILNIKKNKYSRLSIIGLLEISNILKKKSDLNNDYKIDNIAINLGQKLGFNYERIERDISVFSSSIEKLKQTRELIELINKK